MVRSTVAHIDLAAIQSNYRAIASFLAAESPGTPPSLIAVVKANAYGHGAGPVALALERAGAEMLACADIEEASVLRAAGVRAGILVFGAMSVSDLGGLFELELVPTISTPTAAHAVEAEAARRGASIRYHLKIDTGMHRLGFRHDNLQRTVRELLASPHLQLAAVYTHFATAENAEHPLMDEQRAAFEGALVTLDAIGAPRVRRHAANSAAILRDARVWLDAVRPGLLRCPAAAGDDCPSAAGHAAREPRGCDERSPVRRFGRVWGAVHGRLVAPDCGGASRLRGWPRSAARRPRPRARRRAPGAHRRCRVHGHDHDRRHGRAVRDGGRGRHPGPPGRGDHRRSRDGRGDRNHPVGDPVPGRDANRAHI
jgi:hypothetical protein